MTEILTPISPGELLDKITILNIKLEQISDQAKRANVAVEHKALSQVISDKIPSSETITNLTTSLQAVNQELWNIEDDIRDCERDGDFGEKFIALARAVYVTNDKRADLKKQINIFLGSRLIEEKSYAEY